MPLKVDVPTTPDGDGPLKKAIDGSGDYSLALNGEAMLANLPADVGNVLTGEDTLKTYTLAAGALALLNGVRVKLHGTSTNGAHTKTLRLYYGGTKILEVVLPSGKPYTWIVEATILRVREDVQRCIAEIRALDQTDPSGPVAGIFQTFTDATETEASAAIIKATGEATATNEIVAGSMLVETF